MGTAHETLEHPAYGQRHAPSRNGCRLCDSQIEPVREPWDEVLATSKYCYSLPTKGALVAPWLLVVPRRHVLSTSELSGEELWDFVAMVEDARRCLGNAGSLVQFEHGPSRPGTAMGCGVDHAHLHLLRVNFDFGAAVNAFEPRLTWRATPAPWENQRLLGKSYFAFSVGAEHWMTSVEPAPGRQFFRRVVASALGHADRFDYESSTHPENATKTREVWLHSR